MNNQTKEAEKNMQEIYTNVAVIRATDGRTLEELLRDINGRFECYAEIETEDNGCELEFATATPFPEEAMETITGKHREKGLYMQVVTYNLERELVEHHTYENDRWIDRLKENYKKTIS